MSKFKVGDKVMIKYMNTEEVFPVKEVASDDTGGFYYVGNWGYLSEEELINPQEKIETLKEEMVNIKKRIKAIKEAIGERNE